MMSRRTLLAMTVLLCGSIGHADSAARAKDATGKDPAREAVDRVLRHEINSQIDRRVELSGDLEQHPDSPELRWQSGYARVENAWEPVEQFGKSASIDLRLSDYRSRRAASQQTPTSQIELADWCRDNKLLDQERAHLRAAMDLSPEADHSEILERLGNIQFGNVWLSREQVQQWQIRNQRIAAALEHMGPRLEKLAERLDGSRRQHEAAVANLMHVADSDAIPVIECAFCGRSEPCADAAVEVFAKMDGYESTAALAKQAVFSMWPEVRDRATQPLKKRPFEDFVPALIRQLATPVTRKFFPARWYYEDCPDSTSSLVSGRFVISCGYILAQETEDQFQVAVMNQFDYRLNEMLHGNLIKYKGRGVQFVPEFGKGLSGIQQRAILDRDRQIATENFAKERLIEATVDAANERTDELNRRVIRVLANVTGRSPSPDPAAWWQWWRNFTDTQLQGGKRVVTVAEETEMMGDSSSRKRIRHISCFAAGTSVWTESGQVPIETIRIGDRVLAQDVETGELAYKPVVCTTVRPAKPLIRLQIGDESIVATGGHRFWVSGDGWTKARDLKPKLLVHTVTGNARVDSVETGQTAETYNLVVAEFHDYFVGRTGILVQDLPLPQPTDAIVPGLPRRRATAAR
ncbi:MAG TPA: polymorphic toxin-type HINT domain-containing protein [Planctomycetaceae bacterium]|jgi:hypothetical protein